MINQKKILGIDNLRALCALTVVFLHTGVLPIFTPTPDPSFWSKTGSLIFHNLHHAQAAVILFFVISGFCIHFPQASGKSLLCQEYYIRRFFRICLPMLGIYVLSCLVSFIFPQAQLTQNTIWAWWSLYAELFYYFLYPGLKHLAEIYGWWKLIGVSGLIAMVLPILNPGAQLYNSLGVPTTWLLGLPCWLLGCQLAQDAADPKSRAYLPRKVALTLMITSALLTILLRWQFKIGTPWTLNFFALCAYFWMQSELLAKRCLPSVWPIEKLGVISFSIYICHPLFSSTYKLCNGPANTTLWGWSIHLSAVLFSSFCFYALVELPSHTLAKNFKNILKQNF